MTPEELNRTIEFIIQSQARLAAAQEQECQERLEFQKWSQNLHRELADLMHKQNQLLEIQSHRLDTHEREFNRILGEIETSRREWQKWQKEFQAEARDQHQETLAWLRRIVEKITDRLN